MKRALTVMMVLGAAVLAGGAAEAEAGCWGSYYSGGYSCYSPTYYSCGYTSCAPACYNYTCYTPTYYYTGYCGY